MQQNQRVTSQPSGMSPIVNSGPATKGTANALHERKASSGTVHVAAPTATTGFIAVSQLTPSLITGMAPPANSSRSCVLSVCGDTILTYDCEIRSTELTLRQLLAVACQEL
jgi:hypothetical protein